MIQCRAPAVISAYAKCGTREVNVDAGRLILDLRRKSGLTQGELAIRAGTTASAISRLERGHLSPSAATLEAVLLCLGYRLELQPVPLEPGIDAAQLAAVSAMTPSQRLDHAVASQRSLAGLVGAARG